MMRHRRRSSIVLTALATVLAAALAVLGTTGQSVAADGQGQVSLVQAVPTETLPVTLDGAPVKDALASGSVVGPLPLDPGSHEVVFGKGAEAVASTFEVEAGKSSDLVLHRPAQVGGMPVVSAYSLPTGAIGPGKARVLLAHTATTAPADVRVDGTTVFTNIANGEYAEADVAAGAHEVALFPSGVSTGPILGPISVELPAGTLTTVYAVGNPKNGSMNVVVRRSGVGAATTRAPKQIETGSAGLVDGFRVATFGR